MSSPLGDSQDCSFGRKSICFAFLIITNTDNDQLRLDKFNGSGGIRIHDRRATSPLLYQLITDVALREVLILFCITAYILQLRDFPRNILMFTEYDWFDTLASVA